MPENNPIDLDSPSIYDEFPDDDDNYAADDMELEEEDHGVEEQEDQVAEEQEDHGHGVQGLRQVLEALRKDGLTSFNIILGIASNRTKGSLSPHATGSTSKQYEEVIAILGKTLAPFIDGKLIPCYGFGDQTTKDKFVFSFHKDHSPCPDFEEVLSCYRKILPNMRFAGPTSYAPVVEAAINIVEKSGGQFHTLFIITDDQATSGINISDKEICYEELSGEELSDEELSAQEEQTIESIVNASSYPLSIVVVGVGDGPWEEMQRFKEKIPAREFDNFKFVNFTEFLSKMATPSNNETAFAVAALMGIPSQYKKAMEPGMLRRVTGRAKEISPLPPPGPYSEWATDENQEFEIVYVFSVQYEFRSAEFVLLMNGTRPLTVDMWPVEAVERNCPNVICAAVRSDFVSLCGNEFSIAALLIHVSHLLVLVNLLIHDVVSRLINGAFMKGGCFVLTIY